LLDTRQRLQTALADRYLIERELGRGGMATVHLARDRKHNRPVAIKILHPELSAALGAERFLREIEIAASLSHPHILTLIDSGEADGLLYYVMPFIQGESLRGRLSRERQLPLDEAIDITRHVASALSYAHGRGVVHRDIKPENVMLHEGEAMVADFGIAKAVSAAGGGGSLTQTGMSMGTPAYMSPEQASGEREVDGRSDLYSLGCMLFEMLAGQPPFVGPNAQAVITKRFTDPVPSVRALRDTVPELVDRALMRALAKVPADRFATAAEFARAITGQTGTVTTPPDAIPVTRATPSLQAGPPGQPASKSIAVLPFADMSPQKDQEYLTDGIAEEIINSLTKIQALHVSSRLSSFAFKGKTEDLEEVGRKLKVTTVLAGSLRKAGNKLRIAAQLIDVNDGYQLWSDRYDRDMEDVFAVQDEIAENIAKALRVVLKDEERPAEKPRPENVKAYEYYLRGRQLFHQWRRQSFEFAQRMFERAIEIDPGYAKAHAGLADTCSFLFMEFDPSDTNRERADVASRKALELEPGLAEAHASRGLAFLVSRRYPEAQREFEVAMQLDATLFEAPYFYARSCFQQGNLAEAAGWFERAHAVRPEDYQSLILTGGIYTGLRRREMAEGAFREGLRVAEQRLELYPEDARAWYLGAAALVNLGEGERARAWVGHALDIDPEDAIVLYNVACIYALLGDTEEAIDCLEKAVESFINWDWLAHDADLDLLRSHPRFQQLLQKRT
jgi:serine/threonine protein kinase/Tfp pilus assembly protein PilF